MSNQEYSRYTRQHDKKKYKIKFKVDLKHVIAK